MNRRCIVLAFLLLASPLACLAAGPCFKTPAQALHPTAGAVADGQYGYRVEGRQVDPYSGRTWAMVSRCEHSDWPAVAMADDSAEPRLVRTSLLKPPVPLVRAGSRVKVMLLEDRLHLETSGIAETDGYLNDHIRVRLVRLSLDSPEQRATAVVRSQNVTEMEP